MGKPAGITNCRDRHHRQPSPFDVQELSRIAEEPFPYISRLTRR